ncbi:methylated-DNA--[protein]-cysteine S-methyltransferase [Raineyella fluvialis]|uniref:methylated-DNA--[protein]-cysteine S-methyltransferase n=1 Tax=Raineyella fluvialis TaxID=2662261 RepID=UPI00188EC8FE|nr:methylated-DNA--[protein]-cysteine S-methyltransferase [Raineyella fluvialis]
MGERARWTELTTPFGGFVVAWTGEERPTVRAAGFGPVAEVLAGLDDLTGLTGLTGRAAVTPVRDDGPGIVRSAVLRHLEGDRTAFDGLAVEQPGADFHRLCWQAIRETRFGQRISYGELARLAGAPRGARAAANACAATRVSWILPVHRVVRADGSLGGYGGREDLKEALLDWESSLL